MSKPNPRIFLIELESLHERYTEQWARRIPIAFDAAGYDVFVVKGKPLEETVKVGTFLDINSTTHFKWTQLQLISELFHSGQVQNNDVFFFYDTEFWGMEAVRLLAQMNGRNIKIASFLHAASYTIEDAFQIASHYQKYTEVGWIAACDAVFVGSNYHKQAVIDRRLKPLQATHLSEKLIVTRNPVFVDEYPVFDVPKQKRALLTNRFDAEKRPGATLALFKQLKEKYPDWTFVVTTGRQELRPAENGALELAMQMVQAGQLEVLTGLTKAQYHEELAKASLMVTHSIEENYGYCIAEAIHYNVPVIAREGLSHEEMLPSSCWFSGKEGAFDLACQVIESFGTPEQARYLTSLDTRGMHRIVNEINHLAGRNAF